MTAAEGLPLNIKPLIHGMKADTDRWLVSMGQSSSYQDEYSSSQSITNEHVPLCFKTIKNSLYTIE